MKKILFLLVYISSTAASYCQFPASTTQSNPYTNNVFNGALTAKKGAVIGVYSDTVVANLDSYVKTVPNILITTANNSLWKRNSTATRWLLMSTGTVSFCNGLQNGGIASWNGGLSFNITSANYCINSFPYNSLSAALTLNTADVSLPRIDVIAVDINSNVIKITGIPSANPSVPQVNPITQLYLTSVFIPANAISPKGLVSTIVYDENTEWATSSTGITANFLNTGNPYKGAKAIGFLSALNGSISFTNTSSVNVSNNSALSFAIYRNDVIITPPSSFTIQLTLGSTVVTNSVSVNSSVGYDDSKSNIYQSVSIPTSNFNFTNTGDFDGITFSFNNFPDCYIDYITLQSGLTTNPNSAKVSKIETVLDFPLYTDKPTILNVPEPRRGGLFSIYTGTDSVDLGMIFLDGLGRKWKRQISGNNKLNIQWYGARSTTNGSNNDILPYLNTAQAYIKSHRGDFDYLYIPRDSTGGKYYFVGSTFNITTDLRIIGDGITSFNNPAQTSLRWNINTNGIKAFYAYGQPAIRVEVSQLQLGGSWYTPLIIDSSKHAYQGNCQVIMNNVQFYQWTGDGIHLQACAQVSDSTYGNADFSQFNNIEFDYCNNGFWFNGCDANSINVTNCIFNNNRRWGIYDNGFLGNTYVNCQFTANATQAESQTSVTYNGKYYSAVNTDNLTNINQNPVGNPQYWAESGIVINTGAWSTTKKYLSGGTLGSLNPAARTIILGLYEEGYQPTAVLSDFGLSIGGLNNPHGATINSGANGIVFGGLTGGKAVNLFRTPLRINNTDNDMASAGLLNIADTTYPTMVIGGFPSQAGKYNEFGAITFRGKSTGDAYVNSFDIMYNNQSKRLRFVPDPASGTGHALELGFDKKAYFKSLEGTGVRSVAAAADGSLQLNPSLDAQVAANTAAIQQRADSAINDAGYLSIRKGNQFYRQFLLPTSGGGAGVDTSKNIHQFLGKLQLDSLKSTIIYPIPLGITKKLLVDQNGKVSNASTSFRKSIEVASNYNITTDIDVISVTISGTQIILDLPTTNNIDDEKTIINSSSGNITITANGANIGNFTTTTTYTLASNASITFHSNGTKYLISSH